MTHLTPTCQAAALPAAFLWLALAVPVAVPLLLTSLPAEAQTPCMAHETLAGYLADRFAERAHGLGLIGDQRVMELFVSARGTWTVMLTDRNGVACMVMAGENWEGVSAPAAPEF